MRLKSGALICNDKFMKSAFGRKYLPYIFGRQSKGRDPVTVHVGVLRRRIPIKNQNHYLPRNSIAIESYFTLHHTFNEKYPYCKKIKLVCSAFNFNPKSFRKKARYIELCESDMVDRCWGKARREKVKKKYDILIITEFSNKGMQCKGLQTLGLIEDIAKEFDLRVAVVDTGCKKKRRYAMNNKSHGLFVKEINRMVKKDNSINLFRSGGNSPPMNQIQLNRLMQSSKILLCGSTNDASPKIITEAIIRGLPILLNKNILGGQKYINEENGILYDGAVTSRDLYENYDYFKENLFSAIERSLSTTYNVKDIMGNYYKYWGLKSTSKRLARYLNKTFGFNLKYAFYPQFRRFFKKKKSGSF